MNELIFFSPLAGSCCQYLYASSSHDLTSCMTLMRLHGKLQQFLNHDTRGIASEKPRPCAHHLSSPGLGFLGKQHKGYELIT